MENTNDATFNKNTIPIRWGILIALVGVIITTSYGMFLMDSMGMMGSIIIAIISYVTVLVLLGIMAGQQRKAMGGYITFKQAFQAIFIAILIIVAVSTIYSVVYSKWIDPTFNDRVKEMTLNFSYKIGGEEAERRAAEQLENQGDPHSISGILMSFGSTIVLYSIFGFLIAAIVKRNKPEHLA